MGQNLSLLRRIWNRMFDQLLEEGGAAQAMEKERALSMSRLYDQLWRALNPDDMEWSEWAWPLDIYADNGELFAIYSQSGKMFRVDLSVSNDTLTVGEPIQVTEAFPAVQTQGRGQFFVRRQADGQYRWLMIAGTTVLNRQGELDSSELFDCFEEETKRTGEYPRLDFYHLGGLDPEVWEFGTADFVARDGVCYVASGTFDDHPLATFTIAAAEREPGRWGASIEFRTIEEAELIKVQIGGEAEPLELKVPIYRRGKNTRISVLLEQDAAGLFTTLGVSREVLRMRGDILEKLTELCGDEEEARQFVADFGIEVDRVNNAVKEQGLVHRAKGGAAQAAATADDDEDEGQADEQTQEAAAPAVIELDEEAVRAITVEIMQSDVFRTMHEALNAQSEQLTAMTQLLETSEVERGKLETRIGKLVGRVKALEREEAQKQQEWLEDLPAQRATAVTFRPRFQEMGDDEADAANDPLSSENIRANTLGQLTPVR